jgi:hypothetical protein
MRKFQIVWTGNLGVTGTRIHVQESIGIINTILTPVNTTEHGLQLLTSSGDIVLPCASCVHNRITETISYCDLNITTRNDEPVLNVVVYVLCNGCLRHESTGEYSIAFYVDYK